MIKIKLLRIATVGVCAIALLLFSRAMATDAKSTETGASFQTTCLAWDGLPCHYGSVPYPGENCWEWTRAQDGQPPYGGWGLLGTESTCIYTGNPDDDCFVYTCKTWWNDDIKCYRGPLPPTADSPYWDSVGLAH